MARAVHRGGVNFKPAWRRCAAHKSGAAHIGNVLHRLMCRQAMRDFHNGAFGVAVQQQITFAVHHHGAANFVRPIVVVRDAAQRAFNAAQDNRHFGIGFAAALAVNERGAVGPLAAHVARGVGVVGANFPIGRVAVDHRIHIASRHAPKQIGFAQGFERVGALPIGLGNDAHAKTLVFQHAANHRHAKAGVVDIGVAGDDDHIAAVPAELVHFCPAHGQHGRRAKACRPVLAVTGQRFGIARKKGDVGEGVHGIESGDNPVV